MFDLEKEITGWRREMLGAGIKMPTPLGELEIHLREEIERRIKSGLTEAEALSAAIQAIGQAREVQAEFQKIEAARETREGKIQDRRMMIVTGLTCLFMAGLVLFKVGKFSALSSGEQVSSLAAIATFFLLVSGVRSSHGILPVIRNPQIRAAIGGLCILAMTFCQLVFFIAILPRYNVAFGLRGVAFLWGYFAPSGASIGLTWALEIAARRKVPRLVRN